MARLPAAPGGPGALDARVAARAVALGVAYAALGKAMAVITAFGTTTAGATFWPGAGLTVAVLLRRPRSEWAYYLAAVAVAEAALDLSLGFALPVALGWAIANTLEPFVAAWLLRTRGWTWVDPPGRTALLAFLAAAVVIGPLIGALVGTAVGVAFAGDPWLPRLPRWYVGDAIGVLVVAPALLALHGGRWRPTARASAWFVALALISLLALGPWRFGWNDGFLFLTLPLLILIALRFGTRGAAAGVLVVALVVEAVTASDAGPFGDHGAFAGLVIAQMFVAMSAVTALTVAVLTGELVKRERIEAELRALALRDSLTGLANRRLLFDRIEHASQRLARRPGMLALLFIDVDGFKAINDTYGHATGDAVLVASAGRLSSIVRDQDTVARLGGDEFLVLAEDVGGEDDALRLAARIVAAFDPPFAARGSSIVMTASVGITTTATPVADPSDLVSSADNAMYYAKRAGGRRVAIASPHQDPGAPETVHLAAAS